MPVVGGNVDVIILADAFDLHFPVCNRFIHERIGEEAEGELTRGCFVVDESDGFPSAATGRKRSRVRQHRIFRMIEPPWMVSAYSTFVRAYFIQKQEKTAPAKICRGCTYL